jgi:hypothetical protein
MKKYIIILSLFLCSCTKYRVYNLETKRIEIISEKSGFQDGDTISHNFKYPNPKGEGVIYEYQKCLILNKTIIWK